MESLVRRRLTNQSSGATFEAVELSLVSLLVADYDEAIRFFVDAVGFELIEDSPSVAGDGTAKRWVVVSPGGEATNILLAQASNGAQHAAVGNQLGGRVGFFLRVDNFAAQHERMMAAGVEFLEEPRHEAYGTVAVWRDISGNLWDLLGN